MAFEELKDRQRRIWGEGRYEDLPPHYEPLLEHLARVAAVRRGERVLDLGCGTGALTLRLAGAGAEVLGVDLSPEMVATARRLAAEAGTRASFAVGDAEALDLPPASFDLVTSSVGTMFAPDHAAVARELARVCRPGGRLVLGHWHPELGPAAMFAVLRPFQPPPPPGAGSPWDWGRREHVEALLGEAFDLRFEEGDAPQLAGSGEEVWQLFASTFGPVKVLAEGLDAERREQLHRAFVAFYEGFRTETGVHQPRPYLVVVGTRRPEPWRRSGG